MTSQKLTYPQRLMLHRFYDGELGPEERARAEALCAGSEAARRYVAYLEEVGHVVSAAEAYAWERAEAPTAQRVAEQAHAQGPKLDELELAELVGLLERYHDDEVDEAERAVVEELMEAREDVAAYMLGLQSARQGLVATQEQALEGVDFGGFWDEIAARLPEQADAPSASPRKVVEFPVQPSRRPTTTERPAFTTENHQVLLYRYHDGEVDEDERAQVKAWAEIDESVAATIGALEELNLSTRVAMEQAQERVELHDIWAGVQAELAGELSGRVISLEGKRADDEVAASSSAQSYRREMFVALAAAICTMIGVGLLGDRIWGNQQVVVEKRVVIVDSVEYGDGASVMVTGPMQRASLKKSSGAQADDGDQIAAEGDGEVEQTPTVIWLIDPEVQKAHEQSEADPAEGGEPEGRPGEAEESDAGPSYRGNPI